MTEQIRGVEYLKASGCDCALRDDSPRFPIASVFSPSELSDQEQHNQYLENPRNHAFNCGYRRPQVNHRVKTKRRMIEGVAHEDRGVIERLEDGGYCVVKWESDGQSTSVMMTSLRHELPHERQGAST